MSFALSTQWFITVLVFELIYTLKLDFFEKWRANEEPWPWEEDPIGYKEHWWTCLKKTILNMFVISPITFVSLACGPLINWNSDFNDLPPFWVVALQCLFCF